MQCLELTGLPVAAGQCSVFGKCQGSKDSDPTLGNQPFIADLERCSQRPVSRSSLVRVAFSSFPCPVYSSPTFVVFLFQLVLFDLLFPLE